MKPGETSRGISQTVAMGTTEGDKTCGISKKYVPIRIWIYGIGNGIDDGSS